MSDLIQLEGITKVYQLGKVATRVLMGIDLNVTAGEFVAIMGPSGTGKSTVMHIMGLLDRPTSGTYLFQDQDVTGLSDNSLSAIRNRTMGFVFQAFHLLSRASALQNALLPLTYAAKYPSDAKERGAKALEMVGLGHRLDHRPGEMSGGERQRVAIARALVQDPEVLFADEPTGNLDNRSSYEVMDIFQRLNDEGRTVVIVTHEDEIAHHCKRVIRLNYGRIASDTPVEVRLKASEQLALLGPADAGNSNGSAPAAQGVEGGVG
jgi:ABC-type lipoprotein export system ATPase subunit